MQIAELEFVPEGTPGSQTVAVLDEPRSLSIRHAAIPEPGDGEIQIRIKYVGICGSDIETWRGSRRPEFVSLPARLGHEVAGTVSKVGPNVEGVAVGDLVTCRYVRGAFAEYIVCSPFNVKVMPAGFPVKETSLIEVLLLPGRGRSRPRWSGQHQRDDHRYPAAQGHRPRLRYPG